MRIIIVGGGSAAVSAALKARECNKDCRIIIYSEENVLPYRRPLLPKLLCGDLPNQRLFLHNKKFYEDHNIEVKLNTPVAAVNWREKTLQLKNGESVEYHRLLLATGAESRNIAVNSCRSVINLPGLRDFSDLKHLQNIIHSAKHITIIGGGILGLEIADELLNKQLKVTVIERSDKLLNGVVDTQCSEFIRKTLSSDPALNIHCNAQVISYDPDGKKLVFMDSFKQMHSFFTDGVINCTGIVPRKPVMTPALSNKELLVDDYMQLVKCKDVFAAGDCAGSDLLQRGSYASAIYSGSIAGVNMAGNMLKAEKNIYEIRAMLKNCQVYSAGDTQSFDLETQVNISGNSIQKLYYRHDSLQGFTLINDLASSSRFYQALTEQLKNNR